MLYIFDVLLNQRQLLCKWLVDAAAPNMSDRCVHDITWRYPYSRGTVVSYIGKLGEGIDYSVIEMHAKLYNERPSIHSLNLHSKLF